MVFLSMALVIVVACLSSKPFIIFLAKKQLQKVFPESSVSIKYFTWQPAAWLGFSDINIARTPIYEIKIQETGLQFDLLSIFRSIIPRFYIKGLAAKINGVRLQGGRLALNGTGELFIDQIGYDKATIKEIKSKVRLQSHNLFLDALSAKTMNGQILGAISIDLSNAGVYLARLQCQGIDIETLVQDFKLEEKFQMTGKLDGEVLLRGKGTAIEVLKGGLSTAAPGGTLVIKDKTFLENMAHHIQQPLEIVVESFRDYRYNTGVMRLSLEKENLVLRAALEGETGKRNLEIIVHNVIFGKGEQ